MGKVNIRSEAHKPEEQSMLDVEHELPVADDESDTGGSAPAISERRPDSELEKIRAERDSLLDRLSRAQAEFENARRRAAKEQQEFREYATSDAIRSLLPVVDSLERALQVKSDPAEFRSGVELIYKQLQTALSRLSVEPIVSKGELFNPHFHEAVEMVETGDVPDHQVIEELQRGYKFKDRLLRPAMVKVAKNIGK